MSPFHVGMQVVCVEHWVLPPGLGYGDEVGPVGGQTYTIRDIIGVHPRTGEFCLRLEEISNPVREYVGGRYEPMFRASRFRPVRKTIIGVFTAMLAPKPKVKADA